MLSSSLNVKTFVKIRLTISSMEFRLNGLSLAVEYSGIMV